MVCSYFSTVFIEFVLGVHRCFQCFYLCFHCLSILHGFVAMIFVDFHVFNGLEPKNKNIIYVYIYISLHAPFHQSIAKRCSQLERLVLSCISVTAACGCSMPQ